MTMLMSSNKIVEMNDYIVRYRHNSTDIKVVEELINVTRQTFANRQIYKSFNKKFIKIEKFKAEHVGRKRNQHIKIVIFNDRVYVISNFMFSNILSRNSKLLIQSIKSFKNRRNKRRKRPRRRLRKSFQLCV